MNPLQFDRCVCKVEPVVQHRTSSATSVYCASIAILKKLQYTVLICQFFRHINRTNKGDYNEIKWHDGTQLKIIGLIKNTA